MSILHHAFISIFIALWVVITHYISILMAILSYFIRFTMKRGNADSWNSSWKSSKHWKPILHCFKNPETPRNLVLELIRIIERKKHLRRPTPWPRGWGRAHPYWARPPVSQVPWWPSGAHLMLYEGFQPGKNHKQAYEMKLRRHEAEPWWNQSRASTTLFCRGHFPPGGGNHHHRHHQRSSHQEGVNLHQHLHQHHLISNPSSSLVSNLVSKPQIGTCGLLVVLITPCS